MALTTPASAAKKKNDFKKRTQRARAGSLKSALASSRAQPMPTSQYYIENLKPHGSQPLDSVSPPVRGVLRTEGFCYAPSSAVVSFDSALRFAHSSVTHEGPHLTCGPSKRDETDPLKTR